MTKASLLAAVLLLASGTAVAQAQTQPPTPDLAVLPPRTRGLTGADAKKIAGKLVAGYRASRPEVLAPEDLRDRLEKRDERYRAALEEARRRTGEAAERYRALDFAGAGERLDRAMTLYKESFGGWADPEGVAAALLVRGALDVSKNDLVAARASFFQAATLAPELPATTDDFPPPVVEAYDQARAERAKTPLPVEEGSDLAALAAALGVPAIATARAEREETEVAVDVALWMQPIGAMPARTTRLTLPPMVDADLERVALAATSIAGGARVTPILSLPPPPPRDPVVHVPPSHRVVRGAGEPFWKNHWVWATAGAIAVVGASGGYAEWRASQHPRPGPGFRVILQTP